MERNYVSQKWQVTNHPRSHPPASAPTPLLTRYNWHTDVPHLVSEAVLPLFQGRPIGMLPTDSHAYLEIQEERAPILNQQEAHDAKVPDVLRESVSESRRVAKESDARRAAPAYPIKLD